jgi:uncharacterized protein
MNRVLIVPGLNNSGPGHWQTEWEQRLECSHRIELQDWSTPNFDAWVHAVEIAIDEFAPTYIVAHSFGSLATAFVTAKHIANLRGILLVAPADPGKFDLCEKLPASRLTVPGILVGSLSDPWLSWPTAETLANQWGLEIECAGSAGHINVESGHGEWLEGQLILHRLLHETAKPQYILRDHTAAPRSVY